MDIETILQHMEKERLESFLIAHAKKHPEFLRELEQQALPKKKKRAKVDYKEEVKRCLSSSQYDGYLDRYGHSMRESSVADELYDLTEKARFFAKEGSFEDALDILLSIMEEVAASYEEYEDYDGELAAACQEASSVLEEMLHYDIPPVLMELLIARLGRLIADDRFENYSLADINGLLFADTLKSSRTADALALLDAALAREPDSFRTDSLVKTKLELLKNDGRTEEYEQTLDAYLYLPAIRHIRLDALLQAEAYPEALRLVDGGIAVAETKRNPGTVAAWKEVELRIYRQAGDRENSISSAEELFAVGRNAMDYYEILKELIPPAQWPVYLDRLLNRKSSGFYDTVYPRIYIREEYWGRLMDWVEQHTGLRNKYDSAVEYEPYLRAHYPERLMEMYRSRLIGYAQDNMGREHYRFIAQILKKMQASPGGSKTVTALVDNFRETYASRRAMIEELSGF
ncbi:hypothetical protein [Limibacterium fermenti]|uniref:hypothetical protein n=1 Tax=Limibacterium fermenti TaxID=3229863 RepID=UPI003A796F9F